MSHTEVEEALNALLEPLAALEHERWSLWQGYLHSHGELQPDGSLVLPAHLVARWQRQIDTPYDSLTEDERESDREQVRRYLPLIAEALAPRSISSSVG